MKKWKSNIKKENYFDKFDSFIKLGSVTKINCEIKNIKINKTTIKKIKECGTIFDL